MYKRQGLNLTTANWISAVVFWIVCGPVALGLLLAAGRNLPAADYSTIAYWEVPVALFIGLVIFGEAFTVNTIIGTILIVGGGAIPAVKGMTAARKQSKESAEGGEGDDRRNDNAYAAAGVQSS